MDLKDAVLQFSYAERAKSELIIVSALTGSLEGYKGDERTGARRMLSSVSGAVSSELAFASQATSNEDFTRAVSLLNEAMSRIDGEDYSGASETIGRAISAVTTAAQRAWQVLSDNELV
ncbi:MAG: hypothetical protein APR53_10780 [Methanoculleus sp. SDB]|nr:MAG: hypothetical protein APR53_10780 [Methanoculleus sp. SDB]